MTNGEKLLKIFPNMEINKKMNRGIQIDFDSDWWNAEYKEPTKNDLGVDCISRADVNQVIEDYMDEQYHVLSDRTRERAFGAKVVMARIDELPSVTPQPRWIPVSERLPEPDVEVLVTDDAGGLATISTDSIYESEVTGEKGWYTSQNVTAWMPLPQNYEEVKE